MAHYTARSHLFRVCKTRLAAINSLVVKPRPLTIHASPVRFPSAPGTHRTSSFEPKNVLQYWLLSSPARTTRDSTACLLPRPRKEMALRAHLTRALSRASHVELSHIPDNLVRDRLRMMCLVFLARRFCPTRHTKRPASSRRKTRGQP